MPSKRNTDLGRLGDIASLLALAGIPVTLPQVVKPAAQFAVYLLLSLAVLRLAYSAFHRIRAWLRARARRDDAPRVTVIGGLASAAETKSITGHPRLRNEPYICYDSIRLPDAELTRKLPQAHGIILMHDVNPSTYPHEYREINWLSRRLSIPITRYYCKDFTGEKMDDFLPFDSPEKLVNYASEHLLMKSALRARTEAIRGRLCLWGLCVTLALLVAEAGLAIRFERQLREAEHRAARTLRQHEAMAEIYPKLLAAAAPQATPTVKRDAVRAVIQVAVEEVNRETRDSDAKGADLLVPLSAQDILVPVFSWGPKGHPLPASSSVAGCAMRNRAVVYRKGSRTQTTLIAAYAFDGDPLGQYDPATQTLRIGNDVCSYFLPAQPDHADQTICVPVLHPQLGTPSAVFCITADQADAPLDQEEVHLQLIEKAALMGMMNPGTLLEASSSPEKPKTDSQSLAVTND